MDRWEAETDHGERKGPFDLGQSEGPGVSRVGQRGRHGVRLTGADAWWLAERSGPDEFGQFDNLHLEGANLGAAHLEGGELSKVHLEAASLEAAHLERASLRRAHLEGASLEAVHLEGGDLIKANLQETYCVMAHLEGALLGEANLERADLTYAHLEFVDAGGVDSEGAQLIGAHLEGAHLGGAILAAATLRRAFLDRATNLYNIALGDSQRAYIHLVDVQWGDANLAVVQWSRMRTRFLRRRPEAIPLGDEQEAWKPRYGRAFWSILAPAQGQKKYKGARLSEFEAATRANRQLATALRKQGLTADADRFAYKSQVLDRQVLLRQGRPLAALGSLLLDLISGYGYRPVRSLIAYVLYSWLRGSLLRPRRRERSVALLE